MVRRLEDNRSYTADSTVAIDDDGYLLTQGDDTGDTVKLATTEDPFLGVSYRSTNMLESDSGGIEGAEVAVQQAGQVPVRCVDGVTYSAGDALYMSSTAGVADATTDTDANSTTDTKVGVVVDGKDLSSGDGTGDGLVIADITGQLGP